MSLSIDLLVSRGKTEDFTKCLSIVLSYSRTMERKVDILGLRYDHKIRLDSETKIVFQFSKEL